MELIFAYGAGILTLINPCILPVLPIVLATVLQANRLGPIALAAGMSLSFVALGLFVAVAGRAVGLSESSLIRASAVLMLGFGLLLLVPRFGARFAMATAGISARADAGLDMLDRRGLWGQFAGGALLGAVWSPCIGPTLGGAIGLASQGQSIGYAGSVMVFFALGVSSVMLALAYGARGLLLRNRAMMQALAVRARPILGAVFVLTGVMVLSGFTQVLEGWAVETLPDWLQDLSVAI